MDEVLSESQLSIGDPESASPQKVDEENTDFTVPVRDASSFTGQHRPPIGYRRASL